VITTLDHLTGYAQPAIVKLVTITKEHSGYPDRKATMEALVLFLTLIVLLATLDMGGTGRHADRPDPWPDAPVH
jgi:hypothetical protein